MYEISGYRAVVGGGGAGEWCDRPGQQCEITGYSAVVGGGEGAGEWCDRPGQQCARDRKIKALT